MLKTLYLRLSQRKKQPPVGFDNVHSPLYRPSAKGVPSAGFNLGAIQAY